MGLWNPYLPSFSGPFPSTGAPSENWMAQPFAQPQGPDNYLSQLGYGPFGASSPVDAYLSLFSSSPLSPRPDPFVIDSLRRQLRPEPGLPNGIIGPPPGADWSSPSAPAPAAPPESVDNTAPPADPQSSYGGAPTNGYVRLAAAGTPPWSMPGGTFPLPVPPTIPDEWVKWWWENAKGGHQGLADFIYGLLSKGFGGGRSTGGRGGGGDEDCYERWQRELDRVPRRVQALRIRATLQG
jgi:hypothetical protein